MTHDQWVRVITGSRVTRRGVQGPQLNYLTALTAAELELQTKVREDFTITEKAPTSAFTFKTLIRHIAKRTLTPG